MMCQEQIKYKYLFVPNIIAEFFCAVSNELAPLCFNKLHITSVPDEYIISTQQVGIELEKISLQKAFGPTISPTGY